jgi:hypothetical protein
MLVAMVVLAMVVLAPALPPAARALAAAIATAADPAAHTMGIRIFTGDRYIEALGWLQAQDPPNTMKISLRCTPCLMNRLWHTPEI